MEARPGGPLWGIEGGKRGRRQGVGKEERGEQR